MGTTKWVFSNENLNDFMKIGKPLNDVGLLTNDVSETFQNKAKNKKCWFIDMLLATLGAILLGNMFAGKVVIATRTGKE